MADKRKPWIPPWSRPPEEHDAAEEEIKQIWKEGTCVKYMIPKAKGTIYLTSPLLFTQRASDPTGARLRGSLSDEHITAAGRL